MSGAGSAWLQAGIADGEGARLYESPPNGLRQLIDAVYGQQDHAQEKAHLVPVIDADAVGQLQANAASPHDSQDGCQAGVGFEIILDMAQQNRQ